jgi:phenylacetate-coenzyme A ligase PaaK-like adenylate-forming protein
MDVDDLGARHSDLPLLFLYGRADDAVPYFGCKIAPANVEEAVFSLPELAGRIGSFALLVSEDERATKRLALSRSSCARPESRRPTSRSCARPCWPVWPS